jgi:hypothetical protein
MNCLTDMFVRGMASFSVILFLCRLFDVHLHQVSNALFDRHIRRRYGTYVKYTVLLLDIRHTYLLDI